MAMAGPGDREREAPTRSEYEQLKERVRQDEERTIKLATRNGERVS